MKKEWIEPYLAEFSVDNITGPGADALSSAS